MKSPHSTELPQDSLTIIGEALIILSLPSALPIPTGGIAHSLSVVIIILAFFGLVVGGVRPNFQARLDRSREAVLRFKRVNQLHDKLWHHAGKLLRPRVQIVFKNKLFLVFTGILVILCAMCFWTIIPLADTPPSVAIILFGFALVYKDIYSWIVALITGVVGFIINIGSVVLVIGAIITFLSKHL